MKKKTFIRVLEPDRASLIAQVRRSNVLTPEGLGAIGDELTSLFDRLAAAWGGKKYLTPARTVLFDDADIRPDDYETTFLSLRKHDKQWMFFIETEHCRDCDGDSHRALPLSSASLEIRQRSIKVLPQLELALKEADARRLKELLGELDEMTAYVHRKLDLQEEHDDV